MGGTEAYWQLMQAFSMWSEVSSLSFHDVGDSQPADIDVSFVSGHHNDGAPFDGQGTVITSSGVNPNLLFFLGGGSEILSGDKLT